MFKHAPKSFIAPKRLETTLKEVDNICLFTWHGCKYICQQEYKPACHWENRELPPLKEKATTSRINRIQSPTTTTTNPVRDKCQF